MTCRRLWILAPGILAIFALAAAPATALAAASDTTAVDSRAGGYEAEIEQFRSYVARHLPMDDMPAISIGFYKDGLVWADGFGLADVENRVVASAESAYRLASVTKPMTAIAVLTLVEQGKIDLVAPVQDYVPYFPEKQFPVTVGMTLGHLGEISHYRDYDEEGHFKTHMDTREAIAVFADFDLVAEPGTRYHYSSYDLLGAVIEGAAGIPYGEYLREVLWGPYGMDDTRMDDPYELIPHRVTGYRRAPDGEIVRSEFVDISSRFAAGGTRSTVVDLLRFARGLDRSPALSPQTTEKMFTSMQTRDGLYTGYGMGWAVRPLNGRFRVFHTGSQAETRTYLAYFPSIHFAIAAATNFEGNEHGQYVARLYQLIMDEPMGFDAYVGDVYDRALYEAMSSAFDFGLAEYDRHERELEGEARPLEAAFDWFNATVDRQKLEADYPGVRQAIERGRHPAGGEVLVAVGSHMAAVLDEANGSGYLEKIHRLGPIPFFADYISLYKGRRSYPKRLRFAPAFEKLAMAWKGDWDRTWNDFTRRLAITRATDLGQLAQRLETEFDGACVYPDFCEGLSALVSAGIISRDSAAAASAAAVAVDLYPLSDRPYVLKGVCDLLRGDVERGRESIVKAQRMAPDGAAGPQGLIRFARRLQAGGFTDTGLELLQIAQDLHPGAAGLYDSAGRFYLELGDRERAIASYERALEIDPDFEPAKMALEKILRR